MAYDNKRAFLDHEPMIFDIETAPLAEVRSYVDPPDLASIAVPKNYKSTEVIAAYLTEETARRQAEYESDLLHKAALDWNTARIACLGWMVHGVDETPHTTAMQSEDQEADALRAFWALAGSRPLVGFRIREFDLPMLIQRSRYLGVRPLTLDLGRYSRREVVIDLFDVLTFNDLRASSLMRRSLKSFARRFGVPVADETDGADVPALIATGNYAAVAKHCQSDVRLTRDLALRIGVLRPLMLEVDEHGAEHTAKTLADTKDGSPRTLCEQLAQEGAPVEITTRVNRNGATVIDSVQRYRPDQESPAVPVAVLDVEPPF